jgi:hypothetical protein
MPRNNLEFSRIYVELLYSYSYSNPLCIHYLVVVTPGCIHEREVVTHWCIQHWGIDLKTTKQRVSPVLNTPGSHDLAVFVLSPRSLDFLVHSPPKVMNSLCIHDGGVSPSVPPPDPFPCPHFFPLCPLYPSIYPLFVLSPFWSLLYPSFDHPTMPEDSDYGLKITISERTVHYISLTDFLLSAWIINKRLFRSVSVAEFIH